MGRIKNIEILYKDKDRSKDLFLGKNTLFCSLFSPMPQPFRIFVFKPLFVQDRHKFGLFKPSTFEAKPPPQRSNFCHVHTTSALVIERFRTKLSANPPSISHGIHAIHSLPACLHSTSLFCCAPLPSSLVVIVLVTGLCCILPCFAALCCALP